MENFITKEVCALVNMASNDVTRYHMCGVLIDFKKKRAVATDGHVLGMKTITVPEEMKEADSIIIDRDMLVELGKIKDLQYKFPDIAIDGDMITVLGQDRRIGYKLIDGAFPDYEQVLPRAPVSETVAILNPEYILRCAKTLGIRKGQGFKICHHEGEFTPLTIEANNGTCLVMPMRE